jgi:hypothetical protein
MKIRVLAKHIKFADSCKRVDDSLTPETGRSLGNFCPVAQALTELGYEQVYVGLTMAVVRKGEWRGKFALPPALQAEIQSWDHGFGFRPIEVEIAPLN